MNRNSNPVLFGRNSQVLATSALDGSGIERKRFGTKTVEPVDLASQQKNRGETASQEKLISMVFAGLVSIPFLLGGLMLYEANDADWPTINLSFLEREPSKPEQNVIPDEKGPNASSQAYLWATRTQIEDLQLNRYVRVMLTASGSLNATGKLPQKLEQRWDAFLAWYSSKRSFPPLENKVGVFAIGDELPDISSIWLDGEPSVVFDDGVIAGVGEIVANGWEVMQIGRRGLVLERRGETLHLNY